MRFKLDVSDRETGEIGAVEVEAQNAQRARQYVRDAGYMVWATEPVPSPDGSPESECGDRHPAVDAIDPLVEQARQGTFRAHPIRFIVSPLLRLSGGVLLYLSAVFAVLGGKGLPVPAHPALTAENFFLGGFLVWIAGWWIGRPVAKGRMAQRALADAEMVCRYCRRRGHVSTHQRGIVHRRLWGHCTNCGIRWPL